jgi:hypothetical protein
MAKLIEADALKAAIRDDANIDGRNYARVKRHINEAEAVELVMCKDCKHRYFNEDIGEYCCEQWADGFDTVCTDEEFCSRGERKDNG